MGVIQAIYDHSPISIQNLIVSARGWDFRFNRANPDMMDRQLTFLLESQYWNEEQFLEFQLNHLRGTLRSAFLNVPSYRQLQQDLGCLPEDFKNLEDLRKIPVLEKQRLRGHEGEFLNAEANPGSCITGHTSGTTGTPLHIFESTETFSRRITFVGRLRTWAGLSEPHYPRRAQFTGRSIVPNGQSPRTRVYWRHNRPGNALLLSTTHLSADTIRDYVRALRQFEPELIDGYPSALLIIARFARALSLPLPKPKAIIVSAETLEPEHRVELSEAFGCSIFNQYASSEPSCFWCDCEHGNMHENPEYGISEILDPLGNPVAPGEEGEVVVTSFLNPVMPLIRYRLGDVAIRRGGMDCPCGRRMPLIEKVVGRVDDILFVPDRGYVGRMDPVFKGLSSILETQIIQEDLDRIRVLLVPAAGYDEAVEEALLKNLREKLGQTVTIEVELVPGIPRGANGKFRSVLSKVRDRYPDRM